WRMEPTAASTLLRWTNACSSTSAFAPDAGSDAHLLEDGFSNRPAGSHTSHKQGRCYPSRIRCGALASFARGLSPLPRRRISARALARAAARPPQFEEQPRRASERGQHPRNADLGTTHQADKLRRELCADII